MVEFEAAATEPPAGWAWRDLDAGVIVRLGTGGSRAAVASWARERVEGWSSLRAQWSQPGWFARASTWMVDQMASDRLPVIGAPRHHRLWGLSVILRATSADGDIFFKCSSDALPHEAVVTQALATIRPELVPEVIAVDGAPGRMLMRDLGAPGRVTRTSRCGSRASWRTPASSVVAWPDREWSLSDCRSGRCGPGRAGRGDGPGHRAAGADASGSAGTVAGDSADLGRVVPTPRGDRTGSDPRPWRPPSVERGPRPRCPRASSTGPTMAYRTRSSISPPTCSGPTTMPYAGAWSIPTSAAWSAVASPETSASDTFGLVVGALDQVQTLPDTPADADRQRCGRRTGDCRPLLDRAHLEPCTSKVSRAQPDLRPAESRPAVACRRIPTRTEPTWSHMEKRRPGRHRVP